MSKLLAGNGPNRADLQAAIDACLKEVRPHTPCGTTVPSTHPPSLIILTLIHNHHPQNATADASTVKAMLKQSNPQWKNIPERRVKKLMKAATAVETAKPRFALARRASKLFQRPDNNNNTADTDTAPLDSPLPAEIETEEPKVVVEPPVVAEEATADAADDAELYKDDNDGQRNDCAMCQSCAVM